MLKAHTHLTTRALALLLTLALTALALPALANDNGSLDPPARKSMPKNQNAITITTDSEVIATNGTITMATSFMNVPDGFLTATIIGGWAFPHAPDKFGNITARLDMLDTPGARLAPGKYTLIENLKDADPGSKPAALKFQDVPFQATPHNLQAVSGTLELDAVTYAGDKIKSISLTYEGTFRSTDPTDSHDHKLSGSITVQAQ